MSAFVLPNRDNIKKWTCPHCRRQLDAYRRDKHVDACPKRPEAMARLKEALPDPDNPGVIIAYNKYKTMRDADPELPSCTIVASTWGEWSAVAHAFGLITWDEFEQRKGDGSLLPATIAELRRLSVEYYGGVIGPNYSDYMEGVNQATGAQRAKTLTIKFGDWETVLSAVGLQHASMEYYWHARKMRREERKKAADPEAALNAPLGPDDNLAMPLPPRPVPVIVAQPTPDKLGMIYKLPKLPDDIAPRVYGHVVSQVIETARETRYQFR